MNKLILIRHSIAKMEKDLPPDQWRLSAEGRRRCKLMAEEIKPLKPDIIISSSELKAQETANILAGFLEENSSIVDGLHEHKRKNVAILKQSEFEARIASLFENPGELVFGSETANQAKQRYTNAVNEILRKNPGKSIAIVSHGTVMSLFIADFLGIPSFNFWQRLKLPCYFILNLPSLTPVVLKNSEFYPDLNSPF